MNIEITINGAVDSCRFFGSFYAVKLNEKEYVINCAIGTIGHTVDPDTAKWLPSWLDSAMAEAFSKKGAQS